MAEWSTSPPTRAQAWYGSRMVRDLNKAYLEPLKPEWPANRLGPGGDGPKVSCKTCHQGANKPMLGANMIDNLPVPGRAQAASASQAGAGGRARGGRRPGGRRSG